MRTYRHPNQQQITFSSNTTTPSWGSTKGILVTGGTAHAPGTIVDLISAAANTHDSFWISVLVQATSAAATQTDMLLSILLGATGSESVIIPHLLAGNANSSQVGLVTPKLFCFPLYIPAGTRISGQLQSLIVSDTARVVIQLEGGGQPATWVGRRVEAVGVVTASSRGTDLLAGSAARSAFTSMGSTVYDWNYVLPYSGGSGADTTMTDAVEVVDIGSGSATFRNLTNFPFAFTSNESSTYWHGGRGRFVPIPAGTALQLRGQSSIAAPEAHDWVIYGVY